MGVEFVREPVEEVQLTRGLVRQFFEDALNAGFYRASLITVPGVAAPVPALRPRLIDQLVDVFGRPAVFTVIVVEFVVPVF